MDTDFDTFLITVYCEIDTVLAELALPPRPGPAPKMADSEVLTLVLIGQWRGSSERALLRWVASTVATWFPVRLSQSAFNCRVRRLGPVCHQLRLADLLVPPDDPYEVVDTVAVPFARQCRGRRHRLFGEEAGATGSTSTGRGCSWPCLRTG